MRSKEQFLALLKTAYKKAEGDHDHKLAIAWRAVDSTVKKGEEDQFDEAYLALRGISKSEQEKRKQTAIESIEAAYNSPAIQRELRLMDQAGMFNLNSMKPENSLD